MARIDVGGAIGAGFGLIGRRPLSVLIWGVPPVLLQVATFAITGPYLVQILSEAAAQASGGASAVSPVQSLGQSLQMQGLSQLMNVVALVVGAVVYCGVWRAVLQPQRASFAYLRVGIPELSFAGLSFGAGFAFFVALLVILIPTVIIGGVAAGVSQNPAVGLAIAIPIFFLVVVVAGIYLALRFAFVGPMMVADGKFHLFESWTATRGHVGSLFLIGLGLFGIFLVLEIVLGAIIIGLGAGIVAASGGFDQLVQALRQSPADALTKLWPFAAGAAVLLIPVTGCLMAIGGAPWARAYQDLSHDTTVATFA